MKPEHKKLARIAALVAASLLFLLLLAYYKGKSPTPPGQVEVGKPETGNTPAAAGVKLDSAEPVVPTPSVDANQATSTPVPAPIPSPIPATGGDGSDRQAKLPLALQADNPPPVQANSLAPPASTQASVPFAGAADVQALHEAIDRQAQASKEQAEHLQSALATLEP